MQCVHENISSIDIYVFQEVFSILILKSNIIRFVISAMYAMLSILSTFILLH